MNTITSFHPRTDTQMAIHSWVDSDGLPRRALTMDYGTLTIHMGSDPELARNMAELLLQIAEELEQECNPCATV